MGHGPGGGSAAAKSRRLALSGALTSDSEAVLRARFDALALSAGDEVCIDIAAVTDADLAALAAVRRECARLLARGVHIALDTGDAAAGHAVAGAFSAMIAGARREVQS